MKTPKDIWLGKPGMIFVPYIPMFSHSGTIGIGCTNPTAELYILTDLERIIQELRIETGMIDPPINIFSDAIEIGDFEPKKLLTSRYTTKR